MELGEKIKNLRRSQKVSQAELSSLLNINRNHLSRIETGKSELTASMIKTIVEKFDIDVNSLLDIKEEKLTHEEKIQYITDNCYYLEPNDLDTLIKIVSVMRKEYVKKQGSKSKE